MSYQQAHTGIRKLVVGRRWSTGYIGATSCTVKRATRADLRLTPLSLQPHPLSLASTFSLSFSHSLLLSLSLPLSLSLSLSLFVSLFSPFSLADSPLEPTSRLLSCSNARLLRSTPLRSVLFCSVLCALLSSLSPLSADCSLARLLARSRALPSRPSPLMLQLRLG